MDYCCLELFVYRNSQYFLCELLGSFHSTSHYQIAECEKLVDFHYPYVPYSEERLALFVMAVIGMDLADACLRKAFERGKRRTVIRMQKRFVCTQEHSSCQRSSVNITALLLGVKGQLPCVEIR